MDCAKAEPDCGELRWETRRLEEAPYPRYPPFVIAVLIARRVACTLMPQALRFDHIRGYQISLKYSVQ